MGAEQNQLDDRDQILDDVVAAYLDASETAGPQDHHQWLARYPALAAELAEFFADEEQFGSLMAPFRAAAQSSTTGRPVHFPPFPTARAATARPAGFLGGI